MKRFLHLLFLLGMSGAWLQAASPIPQAGADAEATAGTATRSVLWSAAQLKLAAETHGGGGTGDVVGPASATDNAFVIWDLATGKLVKNSAVTLTGSTTTGQVTFPVGSVGTPSVTFAGDTAMGMYRFGANQIGFSANGTQAFMMDASGTLYGRNGASGAYLTLNSSSGASLGAQGTNQNVNLNPSGTGQARLTGTGGFVLPSTNTGGINLFNTADEATNYEKLSATFTSNVATILSTSGGTGTQRALSLKAVHSSNTGAASITLTPGTTAASMVFQIGSTQANAGSYFTFSQYQSSAQTGTNKFVSVLPIYNQSGTGTAANTDFQILRTETTATGSGPQYLIQAGTAALPSLFTVSNTGKTTIADTTASSNTTTGALVVVGGVGVNATINTLRLAVSRGATFGDMTEGVSAWGTTGRKIAIGSAAVTDTLTAASGTVATAVFSSFAAPTLAATNASVVTTDAANVYIAGAPIAGTNQTITNPYALWVDSGDTRLDGALQIATATPASASAAGVAGTIAWDADYVYVCTATNQWKRSAISTW